MKAQDFTNDKPGELLICGEFTHAYLPNPLPPTLTYDDDLVTSISDARAALATLNLVASQLETPLLVATIGRTLMVREANISSRIEGTYVDLSSLLLQPDPTVIEDAQMREVKNLIETQQDCLYAMHQGQPITSHFICGAHQRLFEGVKYDGYSLGCYRKLQNLIGRAGDTIETARYVPPPPEHVQGCMEQLINFIEAGHAGTNPLVAVALVHYQFESIHPFEDGNGRLGRVLILLMLIKYGLIGEALLSLSPYLERHRHEYTQRMYEVSCQGKWKEWIVFFMKGIQEQCADTIKRCEALAVLRADFKERLRGAGTADALMRLIDLLFRQYSFSTNDIKRELGLSHQQAREYVRRLLEKKIIVQRAIMIERSYSYYSPDILAAVTKD